MSLLRQFINRYYYKTNDQNRITIVGLDYSGKTSLLCLLKETELIPTVPTLGFNAEEFVTPTTSKKDDKVSMTGWDIGTGCGMDFMMGIIEMYIREGDALVWMVDSTDKERMPESVDKLRHFVSVLELGDQGPAKAMPFLILANKQDLAKAQGIDDIRIAFSSVVKGKIAAVFPISLARGLGEEGGLPQAFDWLKVAIQIARSGDTKGSQEGQIGKTPEAPLPHQTSVRSPGILAQKLNEWLGRIEGDLPPQEFLALFDQVALPRWDHHTHIRLAFLILKIHGRQKGKDMIFEGIRKYISESKGAQTTGRTYHVSMTYFWIQIVHFGIQNTTPFVVQDDQVDDIKNEFVRFLLANPYVVDGQLWTDYYTKDVLMGPEARTRMVLPDKKPLPSIPSRDSVNKLAS